MIKFFAFPCVAALLFFSAFAHAEYPEKPIRLVVPYAPGGNIDATARTVSDALSEVLGKPIIVENRPGAGGMVGTEYVTKAPADGYMWLMGSTGTLATNKALRPKLTFDPIKDLAAVSTIARVPLVLIVNPKVPVKNLAEFLAYAKANPGKLSMGSSGTGTSNHLSGELFQTMSGTKFLHVPYKGSSQALTDLMGGQVDIMFDQTSSSLPFIKAGKLRPIGVTTSTRSAVLPDLPTLAESGIPGFESSTTAGILVPAGTPKPIIDKINAAVVKVLGMPTTQKNFMSLGAEVLPGTPADFDKLLAKEVKKWTKVVQDGHIEIQ